MISEVTAAPNCLITAETEFSGEASPPKKSTFSALSASISVPAAAVPIISGSIGSSDNVCATRRIVLGVSSEEITALPNAVMVAVIISFALADPSVR